MPCSIRFRKQLGGVWSRKPRPRITGLMVTGGKVTCKAVADSLKLPNVPLEKALAFQGTGLKNLPASLAAALQRRVQGFRLDDGPLDVGPP